MNIVASHGWNPDWERLHDEDDVCNLEKSAYDILNLLSISKEDYDKIFHNVMLYGEACIEINSDGTIKSIK